MAWFSSRNRPAPQRPAGLGAGAWHRRRRHGWGVAPYDDIDSRDGTWLSLSLDMDGEPAGPRGPTGSESRAPVPTRPPSQSPPFVKSAAGDSPASSFQVARSFEDPGEPSVVVEIEDSQHGDTALVPTSGGVSFPRGPRDGRSVDTISVSGDSETAEALSGPILEEDTEAVAVFLPDPIPVTLVDELMPWPPLLVAPTLVLPGAWPPPLGALAQSAPSGLDLQIEDGASPLDELALDGVPVLSGSSKPSLVEGPSTLEPSLSVEVVIEDDSVADVSIVERLATPQSISPASTYGHRARTGGAKAEDGKLEAGAPRVASFRGPAAASENATVESAGSARSADDPPAGELSDRSSGDDDIPTEVSMRDALEEALEVLRTMEPGTLLSPLPEAEGDSSESEVTAEDPFSLELDDDELQVDPAVRSDMDLSPVATPRWDRTWLGTGAPTLSSNPAPTRAFIELRLTPASTRPQAAAQLARAVPRRDEPGEHRRNLRPLAERPEEEGVDDDWLADLPEV